MRKTLKRLSIGLAVMLVILASLLPAVVPPIAEQLVRSKVASFGLNASVRVKLDWCWRNGPGLEGSIRIFLVDTPWRIRATFGASCCEWTGELKIDETTFSESDPAVAKLLELVPVSAVSNLTFSGSVALSARAERTFRMPVPVWSAKMPVRNLSASAIIDGLPAAIDGLSVTPAASGIASHLDIAPMFLRLHTAKAAGFALTNFSASVRATERALFVTEATAGLCGGKVALYSLFLNPTSLNAGFTLFVDDVDAGEILAHFNGFHGDASGRLHGKIKLFVKEGGRALRLGDAFLYSTPGETGKIRLSDPTPVTDNLALAGLDETTRANIANALTDLDYSVLRLNLLRGAGKGATLSTTVRGTATRGKLSVPVDITLNFNGELEQIINTGLGYSNLLKGTKK